VPQRTSAVCVAQLSTPSEGGRTSLKAFWFFSAGYFQFRRRTLDESDWFEIRAVIHYWLRTPGCREWWKKLGQHMYGEDFVALIESEIAIFAARQNAEGGR
jgi:hypothetical protein